MTDDGRHRISILVTPLQPPFTQGFVRYSFVGYDKELAVSKEDAANIKRFLFNRAKGQMVQLEEAEDGQIRLSIVS